MTNTLSYKDIRVIQYADFEKLVQGNYAIETSW
jgi:hypothetical protein